MTAPDADGPIPGPRRVPGWPVLLLAAPAAVAIWSGWVGLGELAGFGVVHPLPGIADGVTINTAITLPIGMECYAAFAMSAWLTPGTPERARRFARGSAIGALLLGALGQIAYHLMTAAGVTAAPWPITALVACLPVGVLGMGAALAHLLAAPDQAGQPVETSDRGHRNAAVPDSQSAGAAAAVGTRLSDNPGPTDDPTTGVTEPPVPATRHGGAPPAAPPRVRDRPAARRKAPAGRVLFADYLTTARAAFTPGTTVTPAWVREVTGCSRGLSSRLAAALRAETEQTPPTAYQPGPPAQRREATDSSTDQHTDQDAAAAGERAA